MRTLTRIHAGRSAYCAVLHCTRQTRVAACNSIAMEFGRGKKGRVFYRSFEVPVVVTINKKLNKTTMLYCFYRARFSYKK